jgi:transposase-like protein
MLRILPHIASLQEHLHRLIFRPEDYRPERCRCGLARLWRHGHYKRKPRENGGCAEVKVPRFRCAGCNSTCSVLPSCVAPRRWYMWSMQQAVLVYLLCGIPQEQCAQELAHLGPGISTMQRWWRWLKRRHEELSFHLRGLQPQWGRAADWRELWLLAMEQEPLRELMAYLDAQGLSIP